MRAHAQAVVIGGRGRGVLDSLPSGQTGLDGDGSSSAFTPKFTSHNLTHKIVRDISFSEE